MENYLAFSIDQERQQESKISAALAMSSEAVHVAAEKHITPPMDTRKRK